MFMPLFVVLIFQWFLDQNNNECTKNIEETPLPISFNVFLGCVGIGFWIQGIGQQTVSITTTTFSTYSIVSAFGTAGCFIVGY